MKRSNLIPITRIYDIYHKYTYSEDVKKFMDEIVDIDRANVCTKADMVNILDEIRAEIKNDWQLKKYPSSPFSCGLRRAIEIIDKYNAEIEPQESEDKK